jgi:hypothetical protein
VEDLSSDALAARVRAATAKAAAFLLPISGSGKCLERKRGERPAEVVAVEALSAVEEGF